jgi:hypothetical protein
VHQRRAASLRFAALRNSTQLNVSLFNANQQELNMLIHELSPEVRAVAELFMRCQPGEVVTFPEMSAVIGSSIFARRYIITSARRVAEREAGAVFTSERSIGYKRLEASAVANVVGSSARSHIRKSARRGVKAIIEGTRRVNDLAPDVQRKVAAEMSALGLIEHIARDSNVKPGPEASTKPQPVAVTARALLAALDAK